MAGKNKVWILIVLILAGLVIGGLLGSLASQVNGLSWLNYSKSFGLEKPIILTLEVIQLTFGLMIHFNIASILGMLIGILIYTRIR